MRLKLRLTLEENGQFVCFRHAIQHAIAGDNIETEVDTEGDGNDMRSWYCKECSAEAEERGEYAIDPEFHEEVNQL